MKRNYLTLAIIFLTGLSLFAEFNWNNNNYPVNQNSSDKIGSGDTNFIVNIPKNARNIKINIDCPVDVDLYLTDTDNNVSIIGSGDAGINSPSRGNLDYNNTEYIYSGYSGDGSNYGNEWIIVNGTTNNNLKLEVYGYFSGFLKRNYNISYSWEVADSSDESQGTNNFQQNITADNATVVGTIPVGKKDVEISIPADSHYVDLQLFDGDNPVIAMREESHYSVDYKGMGIIWYESDDQSGSEYIRISGEVKTELTIKLFSYSDRTVNGINSWGIEFTDPEVGDYALSIYDKSIFDQLSKRDDFPGAMQVREVKFLITGIDTGNPVVYFMNSKKHEYHYNFATDVLGWNISNNTFNKDTYFTDTNRKNLAGSIVEHSHYTNGDGEEGIYTIQFWPTDPVKYDFVRIAWDKITAAMSFSENKNAYFPVGETQKSLYETEISSFQSSPIKTILNEELFGNVSYSPLNLEESFGLLKVIEGKDVASVKDIVIFKSVPNDLTHVAGIITEDPQTPLSHINLKAKQNNTPNAYIKNASTHPNIVPFIGKYVHFQVTADGFVIEEATIEEVNNFFESVRPTTSQIPVRELSVTAIADLDNLGSINSNAYGSKAANVAELRKILPEGMVPEGFAIPFYYYDEFMKANNFYQEALDMMSTESFRNIPAEREAALKAFRKKIKAAPAPEWIDIAVEEKYQELKQKQPLNQNIRARSSTNNEDLVGFNGAGLYSSYTHKQDDSEDEGRFIKSVKQVWSSLWTYRAFEERDFYRIDHNIASMGVLVHPNYKDELANGVAVTKNIFDIRWEGYYINVQIGEDMITNPDEESVSDEILVSKEVVDIDYTNNTPQYVFKYENQYIRHSNKTADDETVLSKEQIEELVQAMETIQKHFKEVYNAEQDENFAMDIEFKITAAGILNIKQARPWID